MRERQRREIQGVTQSWIHRIAHDIAISSSLFFTASLSAPHFPAPRPLYQEYFHLS